MVVGEGLLNAARFALRVVACGNALSLALESNLGRGFSSFPAWAEYLIADSFESSRTFESDGGGGRITQRCALRPSGRFPPKGADCKSAVIDFEGSNPSPTTITFQKSVNSQTNPQLNIQNELVA